MLATPIEQRRLLDLAEVDREILRLTHQRSSLPELGEINQKMAKYRQLATPIVEANTQVSDLKIEVDRLEGDLSSAKARLERNQTRVDQGQINDAKALQSILDENEHLKGRIANLEEQLLNQMMEVDQCTKQHEELVAEQKELETQVRALVKTRDEKVAGLNAQLKMAEQARKTVTDQLPRPLVELYDKIAARNSDVGAGELKDSKCTGCGLLINQLDLKEYYARPVNEVIRCEECGRILVR